MKISNLLVQYLKNPIGIETRNPILTYILESEEKNQSQSAYCILVSSSVELLHRGKADIWDSGKVYQQTNVIEYGGTLLKSRQKLYWKVKVWDASGVESEWSNVASWEMGLLEVKQWKACWIGQGDAVACNKSAAPQVAKDFWVEKLKYVRKARVYISGLGLFQASVNGRRLDHTYFDPGESDYSKTVYYVTYDITSFIKEGLNAIGVVIGNGQYVNFLINPVMRLMDGKEASEHRYQKDDGKYVRHGIYGEKKVIAQIEVMYEDGHTEMVAATDDTWKLTDSPVTFNNWYGGEDYDGTVELSGWDMPGTDRTGWRNAIIMKKPLGKIKAREFLPVRIIEKFPVASVIRLESGNWLVDMGRNVAGFLELQLYDMKESHRGTVISMYPAEILNDEKTAVDQASCTQSWCHSYHCSIKNSYTVKGAGEESWHPSFCYQGARYVEVTGFPGEAAISNFNCCVLRVSNEKTGIIKTSNDALNQINTITECSIESNMFFSFTDCPQIEKLGWLETSHLMFRSMAFGYDIRSWIPKIVQDMIDSQTDELGIEYGDSEKPGYIPAIAPEFQRIVGLHRDPNWGGASILTPWEYYQTYGDISILRKSYDTMLRYMQYLESRLSNGLLIGYAQMGDWGQIEEDTPKVLVENCSYYHLLDTMVYIAALTEHDEEAKLFRSKAFLVKKRFHENQECYQADSRRYGNGSQASYGCVLFSGIVLEDNLVNSVKKLVEAVKVRGYHLSCGEVGLKQVFDSLARYGRSDIVYKMVMNDTPPSYKYFVEHEMTTLPEYWNYDELWNGMVRSRNHAMMGHVKEWISSYVLGVRLSAPGYQSFVIEPVLTEYIKTANGGVMSTYGMIYVHYTRNETQISLEVNIPIGTKADIGIPRIGLGELITDCDEYCVSKTENTYWIEKVGSGKYQFELKGNTIYTVKQ